MAASPPLLVTLQGRRYVLPVPGETLIGSRGCAILLTDPTVKPQHAKITTLATGQATIEDLGGGTQVNGQALHSRQLLQSGDTIVIGQSILTFYAPAVTQATPLATPPPIVAGTPVATGNPAMLPSSSTTARQRGEQVLWIGRPHPLLSPIGWLSHRYRLTEERLRIKRGLLNEDVEEVELVRVKDLSLHRSFLQRLVGVGTIQVYSIDQSLPVAELRHVRQSDRVREAIRNAVRDERKRHGIRVAEIMT
jgi:hypothetical protein